MLAAVLCVVVGTGLGILVRAFLKNRHEYKRYEFLKMCHHYSMMLRGTQYEMPFVTAMYELAVAAGKINNDQQCFVRDFRTIQKGLRQEQKMYKQMCALEQMGYSPAELAHYYVKLQKNL